MGTKLLPTLLALLLLLLAGCETRERRGEQPAPEPTTEAETERETETAEPDAEPTEPETEPVDTEGARLAAEELLAALQTGEPERIRENIDYSNLLLLDEGAPEASLLAILKKLTFEALDVSAEQNAAEATVTLSNVDVAAFFPDYLLQCMKLEMDNSMLPEEEQLSREELDAETQRIFFDVLDASEAVRVETEVVIRLDKSGGNWNPRVSKELRDAVTGGYFAAREQTSMG